MNRYLTIVFDADQLPDESRKHLMDVCRAASWSHAIDDRKAAEKERDQLESIIKHIESRIPLTPNTFGGSYMLVLEQADVDILRQNTQEADLEKTE